MSTVLLQKLSTAGKGSHIQILGVAYKKNIEDIRESPALDMMLLLKRRGAQLTYSDPQVPQLNLEGEVLKADDLHAVASADRTVIVTDHAAFNYREIAEQSNLIVDTRNALTEISSPKIARL
jgi:UDP-N-acetyl-D-glucosamine dehydrogenase